MRTGENAVLGRRLPVIRLVSALFVAAPLGPAWAADLYVSGQQADALCRESQEWCVGFVTGALDGWAAFSDYYPGEKFCSPAGTNTGQIKELFVHELESRTGVSERPAAYVLYERLIRDFPCSPGGDPT